MGRQAEFRYQTAKTLTAHRRPLERGGGTPIAGVESGSTPGLYLFDGLLFQGYEIREGDVAVGLIPGITIQSALPGQVAWPSNDAVETPVGLPTSAYGERKPLSALSRLRLQSEFAQLNPYGVIGQEVAVDDVRLDWVIGFQVAEGYRPRTIRLVMINSGILALNVQTYLSGSAFTTVYQIQPKLDPCVVEVPVLPNAVDSNGVTWVRINASGTLVDPADAQFDLDTAWLLQDKEASGADAAVYPPPNLVASGFQYGPNGDDFTGTATDLGTIPAATDVRRDVPVGGAAGVYDPALQADVRQGIMYGANGTEFTGSLVIPGGGGTTPGGPPDVLDADGNLTIVRGDDYDGTNTPAAVWAIPNNWTGVETGATAKVAWRGTSQAEQFQAEMDVNAKTVTLKLTKEQTKRLVSAADLRYDVQLTLAGSANGLVRTLAFGNVTILDTYTDA